MPSTASEMPPHFRILETVLGPSVADANSAFSSPFSFTSCTYSALSFPMSSPRCRFGFGELTMKLKLCNRFLISDDRADFSGVQLEAPVNNVVQIPLIAINKNPNPTMPTAPADSIINPTQSSTFENLQLQLGHR